MAASARANSSRRCSPNARLAASSSRLCARSKNSSVRSISARAPREPPSQRRRKLSLALLAGILRDPEVLPDRSIVRTGGCSGTCARSPASRAHAAAARRYRRRRSSTRPAVGGNRPQIRLTIVLLPEPFGPIRPRISPRATARSTPSTARTPPKCLVRPLQLKHRLGPCCGKISRFRASTAPASSSPRGRTFIASTISPPNSRLRQSPMKRSPSIRKPWMKMTASSVPNTLESPPRIG